MTGSEAVKILRRYLEAQGIGPEPEGIPPRAKKWLLNAIAQSNDVLDALNTVDALLGGSNQERKP